MTMTPGKFIVAMIDIAQSIIAGKSIRIDDALKLCLASNDRLQRGLSASWNDLRIHLLSWRLMKPKTIVWP